MLVFLIVVLAAVVAVLRPVPSTRSHPGDESACSGGTVEDSEQLPGAGSAPRMDGLAHCSQIDPRSTPHIAVARIRFSGNETFADKSDHEVGHLHVPGSSDKCQPLRPFGANAYFHAPSHRGFGGSYEVVTTAVVAHPGPISRAHRDAFFPGGRAAMIVHVYPGSEAELQGLRRGDLIARVAGRSLSGSDPQIDLLTRTRRLELDATLELELLHEGALRKLTLTRKQPGLFGYNAISVPILELRD